MVENWKSHIAWYLWDSKDKATQRRACYSVDARNFPIVLWKDRDIDTLFSHPADAQQLSLELELGAIRLVSRTNAFPREQQVCRIPLSEAVWASFSDSLEDDPDWRMMQPDRRSYTGGAEGILWRLRWTDCCSWAAKQRSFARRQGGVTEVAK